MADEWLESRVFERLSNDLVAGGFGFRFRACGRSMLPTICDGDLLQVEPVEPGRVMRGDIVLFKGEGGFKAHRVIRKAGNLFITRGDSGTQVDAAIRGEQIVGKVTAKQCRENGEMIALTSPVERLKFLSGSLRRWGAARFRRWLAPAVSGVLFSILAASLTATAAYAQVAVDATTSGSGALTAGANTITVAHTSTGTNLVMVVGVSMNINARATSTVSGVTYNGVALTRAGFHNDSVAQRRSEMWYLIAPATGNHSVVVTASIPGTGTIGTVVGVTTFTGADQTSPIRTYASKDGNSDAPNVDVASAINDMVLDTVASDRMGTIVSVGGLQVQQWAVATGPAASDIYGFGTTHAGAASVAMSEILSASGRWSDSAVSIRPLQADMSVSVAGSATQFPTSLTYTITATNGGATAATGVVLTDTLASGLIFVSAVPSQGSCSGTATITCNFGAIGVGGSATLTVTATPTAPGGYTNNASVTATTPDLNTANNSASGAAYSQLTSCAATTVTAGGSLGGVINTYFPGSATASAGATSITLGASSGAATAIASGDLVLVIQMQDAAINSSNSSAYGDGISGSGSTNLNNSGAYEYATATNAVPTAGGTLNLMGAGPGGGLLYTYTAAAATGTQGARRFQVVRVPNYLTATLTSTLTASAWNGSTGGILAFNVSGVLTLGSATVNVDGLGFRGGAGLQLNGTTGLSATNSDYRFTAPAAYAGAAVAGADGAKGEGIAGTPHWVESANTFLNTTVEGYPNGSMARGAPGNAGGGGTDGNPGTASPNGNNENSGGGGGANGGAGGSGGNSWTSNLTIGGLGGSAFPASISRVALGGGGGAGSRNDGAGNNQASSGASGGGIVMIRAGSFSGTATITANGSAAYNATANDGGGGGGAGGTVVMLSGGGGEGGLTIQAHGGRGGDAWDTKGYTNPNRHGPGGGGGGGVILTSGAAASIDVAGGSSGVTLTPGVPYGATAGAAGISASNVSLVSSPGPHSAATCTDMAISKSGTPNPVLQNATLTYTLTVTNNGLQPAAGVFATDVLPTQVSFVSAASTQGTCSQASGLVTCNIGAMLSGAVVTITIQTTALTPSIATNTAVVNSLTADPALANNTAVITTLIEYPNAVRMNSFTATQTANGVLVSWKTGGEMHNLGFNVYRDVGGQKVLVNPSLIAGSALLMREVLEQHGAKSYGWLDRVPAVGGLYWLEDVDLNGARTMHGPASVQSSQAAVPQAQMAFRATTMRDLAQASAIGSAAVSSVAIHVRETVARPRLSASNREIGFQLAARPAMKILVDHEGWYQVTQPQLVAAGFNANVNPQSLHLFAEGVEQAIRVTGGGAGFGAQSAIEFYGTAIDTPYSGQRVYWLTTASQPGQRIVSAGTGSAGTQAQSFIQTLELKPRTTYFAALLRDDTDNFFGPLVSPASTVQTFNVANLAAGQGVLTVALQGVTAGQQHDVTAMVNGATVGDLTFVGQQGGKATFAIPAGVLINGANTVTLTAQQGSNDLSLVDYIDISLPHTFTAESDALKFTAQAGQSLTVTGFVQPPARLLDITNPAQPFDVNFTSTANGTYALQAIVPWTSSGTHTLMAVSSTAFASPAALQMHTPSSLHSVQPGAEMVMLSAPQFASQVQPLASLRRAEGRSVTVINVDDVYDEFNFGERTPYAVRTFLQSATAAWKTKPHYLLLAGDASVDPRDYFGFGSFDFVPTRVVITSELKTASDDWFSDFNNTGFASIATGRLPARTAADAQTMVGKIIGYAGGAAGSWTNDSMLVADNDDPSVSFTRAAQSIQKLLPQTMNVTDVFTSVLGGGVARQNILAGINSGQLLVNYNGHGSVQIWGGPNLFDDTAAASLNNGQKLPLFVMMNCLNGFFHDVFTQSLAEAVMLAPNGGAVAVWASSGLTAPTPQFQMDQTLMQTLFTQPSTTLGDAILHAKSGISDADARRTFILFGDPLMHLKVPQNLGPVPGSPKTPTAPERTPIQRARDF